jgi:hypothetical protein
MRYPYIHHPLNAGIQWLDTPPWVVCACLDLSERHGIPVEGIVKAVRWFMMNKITLFDEADPVQCGRAFSGLVLNAVVDLSAAWRQAQSDAARCTEMLANPVAWMGFWSRRWPVITERHRFREGAADGRKRLTALLGRAVEAENGTDFI